MAYMCTWKNSLLKELPISADVELHIFAETPVLSKKTVGLPTELNWVIPSHTHMIRKHQSRSVHPVLPGFLENSFDWQDKF